MAEKQFRTYHVPLLVLLLVIFLGILIASSMQFGIDTKYSFKNQINYVGGQTKIGDLEIVNEGFLPVKVEVMEFYGCMRDEDGFYREVYIRYSDDSEDYYGNKLEVSAKTSNLYHIMMDYYPVKEIGSDSNSTMTPQLTIYERKGNMGRQFCGSVDEGVEVKTISINYNE